MRYVPLVVVLALVGCRGDDDSGETPDAADPMVDADPGVGCTATTPRSVPLEVFIGPTGLESRMIAALDSAQTTLDIHMYLFTVDSIADAIIRANNRGVAVRVILDPDVPGNDQVRPDLVNAGVPVRNATSLYTFSHAKYVIVDGKTSWIMSMNWNYDAMSRERNYGVVDKDPDDLADLKAIFEMDWAAGGGEPPKPANLTCTRLVVSPNNSKLRLLELINSAQSSIDVAVMYLSETSVRNAIGMAKQRGVEIRVITEVPDEMPDETAAYMKNLGIPMKYAGNNFYLHAKLIVADGVAFVGSENMSFTSLSKNREVGVMVLEQAQVQAIETQFATDWNASTPIP